METELIAEILTYYIHAPLGGLALLSGAMALIAKKGQIIHKWSGRLFYWAMLVSAISAILISFLPNHENPFLFSIAIFSIYFLVSGVRSLRFKNKGISVRLDQFIAVAISITGACMILLPVFIDQVFNIVLTVFGVVSLFFGFRDWRNLKNPQQLKQNWMQLHLGKMIGGYIAATSAFFVVNELLPGVWNWFAPSFIGVAYIIYWLRKLKPKRPQKT